MGKQSSKETQKTCACLKLSERIVSRDRLADLLNNFHPEHVVETGNLWRDLQDLLLYKPPLHIISHTAAE